MQGIADLVINANFDEVMEFDKLDIVSLFYGSLVHDYKHPGFNNGFLINMQSEIAVAYNGKKKR